MFKIQNNKLINHNEMWCKKNLLFFVMLAITMSSMAQKPKEPTSSEIYQQIKKLNVLGTVLYMAAHPDDENTALIAYLANEKLYNTGYLSLTRGDGGQDLIGPEIREKLGLIRTQELLQARAIDGGVQFFARANDFGFSKNPEEVFTKWERNQLLADVVWVIRKFQPDVLITRFPKDSRAGHGHHSASSILAEDAFIAAADPAKFPEQLKYVRPWKIKRIVWNLSPWGFNSKAAFDDYSNGFLGFDIGKFNVYRGKSIGEIAAESRSMHKSQAFGSAGNRSRMMEYFEPTNGLKAKTDLFDGVNTTWSRIPGSDSVAYYVQQSIQQYKLDNPSYVVPYLVNAYRVLQQLPDSYYKNLKAEEIKSTIASCAGLYIEALSNQKQANPGSSVFVSTEITNRSKIPIQLLSTKFSLDAKDSTINKSLSYGEPLKYISTVPIQENTPYSIPYWLKEPFTDAMYKIPDQQDVGKPINDPALTEQISLSIMGELLTYTVPVQYKLVDPIKAEVYSPFIIAPKVAVSLSEPVYMFPNGEAQKVHVKVSSITDNFTGKLLLKLPQGWQSSPQSFDVHLSEGNMQEEFTFMVTPGKNENSGSIAAVVKEGQKTFDRSIEIINYDHIPEQTMMPPAIAKAATFSLIKKGQRIGYLMGAGDNIPAALQQIGYTVDQLTDKDINVQNLKKYDVVVTGVRAYNTLHKINYYHQILLQYVKEGGTLIDQYNVNRGLISDKIGPYPIQLSTSRVTREDAPIKIIDAASPLLNYPNKITMADFEDWVQERGLYFPDKWDDHYKTVYASHDPNEEDLVSGVLWTTYGKGFYIYTCYDWFRELPAGVPGAYRLFVNMLSIGKQ